MEERRLDTRLYKGQSYAMALPSSEMAFAARFFRLIISAFQCLVVLVTFAIFAQKENLITTKWLLPVTGTIAYIGMYSGRLLIKRDLSKTQWWRGSQILSGFIEIIVLITLDISYMDLGISHANYWWALFILPVYRLAEVGGSRGWILSLSSVSIWLVTKTSFSMVYRENIGIHENIAQVCLLTLCTFLPYYIVHALDLREQAAEFWYPLTLSFIKTPLGVSDSKNLLSDIFHKAMDDLITADFGKLWEVDTQQHTSILSTVYEHRHKQLFASFWQKWIHNRKSETTPTTKQAIPVNLVSQEEDKLAIDQSFIARSKDHLCRTDLPWDVCKDKKLNSWLVAPIYIGKVRRPIGYLEVGKYDKLTSYRWQVMEKQALAVIEALGAAYRRMHQVQADSLRAQLIELEQESPDEATLYTLAAQAMSTYFHRPVGIVNYSLATGKIETYAGDYEPEKVERLVESLRLHEEGLSRLEETDIYLVPDQSSKPDHECYFVCRLSNRKTKIEAVILIDSWNLIADTDQQVLRDSTRIISAAVARRRAANLLQPDMDSNFESINTRKRLQQLAEDVQELTSADLVVLYEFENEKPKLPPIIVGQLNNKKYTEKPIVIEDPNPIIKIARSDQPQFYDHIQATPMGSGHNRHGDQVFAVREGIISSVGLPLKIDQRVVGVMWLNFRELQKFDKDRGRYQTLFNQLPQKLQNLKLIETARSQAEQKTRDQLLANLHDRVLQDIIAAGGYTSTARTKTEKQQTVEALEDLSKVLRNLENAETAIHKILDNLPGVSEGNLVQYLQESVQKLQQEYGLPKDLRTDELDVIPPSLYAELYPIFEEIIRNAAKHGKASRISIQASNTNGMLEIILRDNGSGFEAKPENYSYGINGMQRRIKWLNGKMQILSEPGKGTSIILEIPGSTKEK